MDFSKIPEGHPDGEEPLHYYFNHDERIARAPKNVRDFYAGKGPQPPRGIFKSLVATKANRFGLFSILLFCAFIYMYSLMGERPYRKTVGGVEMTLAAFSFADEVYVSLVASAANSPSRARNVPELGNVAVQFSAVDNQNAVVTVEDEVQFYSGEGLAVRTRFPNYDILNVRAEVSFGGETKTLVARVADGERQQ